MKYLNADADGHQQEIVLAGTPSPKKNIVIKAEYEAKNANKSVTRAVEAFYRS